MQAIDTNILVDAEIRSSPHHEEAKRVLKELAEGPLPWAIPWPCIYEFLRVVTHQRVFHPPTVGKIVKITAIAIKTGMTLSAGRKQQAGFSVPSLA